MGDQWLMSTHLKGHCDPRLYGDRNLERWFECAEKVREALPTLQPRMVTAGGLPASDGSAVAPGVLARQGVKAPSEARLSCVRCLR